MKKINSFDLILKGYNENQSVIKSLYPGQYLDLEIVTKPNSYKDIFVKSIFGKVGEIFSENSSELIIYLENMDKYYVESYVKKFYIKEQIKIAPVVIINIFEKESNFVNPEHPFLGDYHTQSDKYIWNEIMDEIYPLKCSVSSINDFPYIAEKLNEYDDCKLVINGEILDVYSELGSKFGNLSKQISKKLIPYLQNPDNFLTVNIASINQNDEDKWYCRLEISIYEKSRLKESSQNNVNLNNNTTTNQNNNLPDYASEEISKTIKEKKGQDVFFKLDNTENKSNSKIKSILKIILFIIFIPIILFILFFISMIFYAILS